MSDIQGQPIDKAITDKERSFKEFKERFLDPFASCRGTLLLIMMEKICDSFQPVGATEEDLKFVESLQKKIAEIKEVKGESHE